MKHREKFLFLIVLWPVICTSQRESLPIKQTRGRCFEAKEKTSWLSNTQQEEIFKSTSKSYGGRVELFQNSDAVRGRINKLTVDIQRRTTDWRKTRISVAALENQVRALDVGDRRITRETRRADGFSVYVTDIQPMSKYARNSRIMRETNRGIRYSVRSQENQLRKTDIENSRIMRETTRDSRILVRSKENQPMRTDTDSSRIMREAARNSRFSVRSQENQLRRTDNENSRLMRDTTKDSRILVRSKENQSMKTDTENTRIMREASRDSRFSVHSKENQLMRTHSENSRIMKENKRDNRFSVRSKSVQQKATHSRDSRITRETTRVNLSPAHSTDNRRISVHVQDSRITREKTRVNRFPVYATANRRISTDVQESRITRETTRANRFPMHSTDNRRISTDVQDSRITRETTRVNRFPVHATANRRISTDVQDSRITRETTRVNRFPVHAMANRRISTDVQDSRITRETTRVNRFPVHATANRRISTDVQESRITRETTRVNRSLVHSTDNRRILTDVQDSRITRETIRVNRFPVHSMDNRWISTDVQESRITSETRDNSLYVRATSIQQTATRARVSQTAREAKKRNRFHMRLMDIQLTSKYVRDGENRREATRMNHFSVHPTDSQHATTDWKEGQKTKVNGFFVNLKSHRKIMSVKNHDEVRVRNRRSSRFAMSSRDFQTMILLWNTGESARKGEKSRSLYRLPTHVIRLRREITGWKDSGGFARRIEIRSTNSCPADARNIRQRMIVSKINRVARTERTDSRSYLPDSLRELFRSMAERTGDLFSRSVASKTQDQYRRDTVRGTELLRFKSNRHRANVKDNIKSISNPDTEIKNKSNKANRQSLTHNKRSYQHSNRENEFLRDAELASDMDERKLVNYRSSMVRTNRRQTFNENMNRISYSAQLYFIFGSIKLAKREYSRTLRNKFSIGRLNRASWSESFLSIRLAEKNWKIVRRRNELVESSRDNVIVRVRNSEPRISSLEARIQSAVDTLNNSSVRNLRNMRIQDIRRRHLPLRIAETGKKPEVQALTRTTGVEEVHYSWHARITLWNSFRVLLNLILGFGAILLACDVQEKKCGAPSVFGDCWRLLASPSY